MLTGMLVSANQTFDLTPGSMEFQQLIGGGASQLRVSQYGNMPMTKMELLQKKYNLGPPRKSKPLSKKTRIELQALTDRWNYMWQAGEHYRKMETRRFG